MTNYNADPGSGGVAVWEQLAQDPEVIAAEQRVGELSELDGERYRLECDLGDHYWNTGVPYVTITSRPTYGIGSDASRYSFHWDRPMEDYERRSRGIFKTRKGQFLNDETRKFSDLTAVDDEIGIGVAEGKTYFVRDGKHIVSPPYDSIQPLGEREFTVTQGGRAVVAKLLDESERAAVLEKRERYSEIMEHFSENSDEELALQQGLAEKVLDLYGVPKDDIEIYQYANAAHYTFPFGESTAQINVGGTMLTVQTWDSRLDAQQRSDVSHNFHANLSMEGIQHSILEDAVNKGVPEWLQPYERKIIDDIENIDRERHEFNDAYVTYCHAFGYRNFTLDTPHVTWSIPMALELARLPIDTSYPYIGQFNSITGGRLNIPEPGKFQHRPLPWEDPKATWQFGLNGEIVEAQ